MPPARYAVHIDKRGRLVLPAEVRRMLQVDRGGLVVLELEAETVRLRNTAEIARATQGLLRDLAAGVDLATELIEDRRAEADREGAEEVAPR